ncbi:SRPBCC family protein [Hoyosella rhizosphaerae]|uniref:Toxin Rv0910/MT0934 n=1 Tax=Hoyosella rhizosphaerae TaxID=1755582 RepID=A0A916UI85_9ACTN|nr:SRPBCC family protein [Hoyosella rhizosphaerae]MBN4928160.1 SRPBCC family protein [Hoyosella rhizosphaerae]GGC72880.1 toxin Rv0910/MT0934 [Hoyosella rhizosphaerae]
MARTSVSLDTHFTPDEAWDRASDLSRYGDWLLLHDGWRGEVPDTIGVGTSVTSVVSVKGMRNRIAWTVNEFDEPRRVSLLGDGVGGTKITLSLEIRPAGKGASVQLDVDFSGPLVAGPIGFGVSRALKGDIKKSLERFDKLS